MRIDGALDRRSVEAVFDQDLSPLGARSVNEGPMAPAIDGRRVLHWSVDDDGSVDETCQSVATSVSMELGRCVSRRVGSWTLPALPKGQRASIQYTFELTRR